MKKRIYIVAFLLLCGAVIHARNSVWSALATLTPDELRRNADINRDGEINLADFEVLRINFGRTIQISTPQPSQYQLSPTPPSYSCNSDSDCPQPGCASEVDGNCMTYVCVNNECVRDNSSNPSNPISKPSCSSSFDCPIPMVECTSNDAECFAMTNPQCVNGFCEGDYNNWPLVQTCFAGPEQNFADWKVIYTLSSPNSFPGVFIWRNSKTGEVFKGTENNCE